MLRLLQRATGMLLVSAVLLFAGCDQPTQTAEPETPSAPQAVESQSGDIIEGQYIVSLKPGPLTGTLAERAEQTDLRIDALVREHNIAPENVLSRYRYSLRGFAARLSDEQVNRLLKE
ncbi:MAG: protease inhibitor I9 family protein, partial [Balneolaceae bacterium]|nr:protease inhibitor I9 family protein [Balneolaceae bacterium]